MTDKNEMIEADVPTREAILQLLRSSSALLTPPQLAGELGVNAAAMDGFNRRLAAMERDGLLLPNRRGVLLLATKLDFIAGRVIGHRDGYGFLQPDDGSPDIYLPTREMLKVLHGDRVLVRISGTGRNGKPEGSIVEVTERRTNKLVGRFLNERGVYVVAPEDQRIKHDILVPPQEIYGAQPGQVVMVQIVEQRIDLRDVPLVTIDGEDARDFDDAVYVEKMETGRGRAKKTQYRLLVAIADVSHYVTPGDALDQDALERSTSVYFPRRVIPMLPEKLSNGLCSLNPEVDRLCLVADMLVSDQGELAAYQFYPAVMHSHARFTYTEVWNMLSRPDFAAQLPVARAALLPHLQAGYELFQILQKARVKRGAIDFETTETYIVCNAVGKIEQIIPRVRNDAHKLIEEFMLAANVCTADFLQRAKHPGLYRIHEGPTPEKLKNLRALLKVSGLNLSGADDPQPVDYAQLMERIKSRPDAPMLQTVLLRSMQQAIYSPDNVGHFGLAYPAYTHFTSPIRRYPDLLTHRAIKAVLSGEQYVPEAARAEVSPPKAVDMSRRAARTKQAQAEIHERWVQLGLVCSANERRADDASRDVEAWLKCFYMRERIGEQYSGTVSGVTPFGLFITLDSLFVEGLVHVSDLGTEYYQYSEALHELRGERTGLRYRLGDQLHVQVSRVDIEARKIDFRLVRGETYQDLKRSAMVPEPPEPKQRASKKRTAEKVAASKRGAVSKAQRKSGGKATEKTARRGRRR